MSKQATNVWFKIETLIFVVAIIGGIISTKLSCLAWLSFLVLLLAHMLLDKNYMEEWCKWLWK